MVQGELGLDDFCGRGPDEGLGVPVGGGDVAGNRAFEVIDRSKDARLRLWRVSLEKKPSTALSQEQEVGVKWNVHLGCSASQAST